MSKNQSNLYVVSLRFWNKIKVANNGCWEWTHQLNDKGYGLFWFQGRSRKAHRFAFYFYNNRIPTMNVLHHCDNRKCVNPFHLFEGTQQDNMADKIAKGRHLKGEDCSYAKLTEEKVRKIRVLQGKLSQSKLAILFSVSQVTICDIQKKRRWKHI